MPATKQQIRQIIADNNSLLKYSFKDILQKLMEAKLDASLAYNSLLPEIFSIFCASSLERCTPKAMAISLSRDGLFFPEKI